MKSLFKSLLTVGLIFCLYYVLWGIWSWIIPVAWTGGPTRITRPEFSEFFVMAWALVILIKPLLKEKE